MIPPEVCAGLLLASLAFLAGYAVAIKVATQRPWPWILRRGVALTFLDRDMADFYDKAAREEREAFAIYVIEAINEVGGPGARPPMTREGWRGILRLAEHRMTQIWRKGRQSPVHGRSL